MAAHHRKDLQGPIKDEAASQQPRRRLATVYDAVAGRVDTQHTLKRKEQAALPPGEPLRYGFRDTTLAPEEVLFRQRRAPARYAEADIYQAHEALPDDGRDVLPDSDVLKAVHRYASHFYEAMGERQGGGGGPGNEREPMATNTAREAVNGCFVGGRHVDERSMDETALLAFGILLEEAAREALGKNGDLVFTEGLDDEPSALATGMDGGEEVTQRRSSGHAIGLEGDGVFWKRRLAKRRKLDLDGNDAP